MVSLDDLVRMDGVIFACEFTPDGKSADYRSKMDIPGEMAEKAAQYISTVTMMFNTLAGAFTKESQMQWTPQHGWTYSGGNWTVIVGGNRAIFADSSKADIGRLEQVLIGRKAEEEIKPRV